jgi:hypothetical protein
VTTPPMRTVARNLPLPTTLDNVIARYLLCLGSQVNYREGRSTSGDWTNENAFGLYFKQNKVAWCSWFASWGAVVASIPATVIPRTGYTPTGFNWFKAHDRFVGGQGVTLKPGDVGYVYSSSLGRVHHVFVVEKILPGNRIQTLEGNTNQTGSAQGNGVYRNTRTLNSSLRFCRPDYKLAIVTAKPPTAPPTGTNPNPPKESDDMGVTREDLEEVDQMYTVADQKWRAQVAPYQSVSDAVVGRILDGKPAPTPTEIATALTAARAVWKPVLDGYKS